MKPRLALVALAVLLLLAALVWIAGDDSTPSRPDAAVPTQAPPPEEPPAEAPRRERATALGALPRSTGRRPPAEKNPEPTWKHDGPRPKDPLVHRITVTVTDASGGRAHGATVSLVDAFAHHFGFRNVGQFDSAETDGDGQVTLTAPIQAAVLIVAERDRDAGIGRRVDPPRDATEDLESAVDVTLSPAFALRGRVVDESGAAIRGAVVTVRLALVGDPVGMGLSVRCAEDGGFALPGIPLDAIAGALAIVGARASGFVPISLRVRTNASAEPLRLELERGSTLRGRCVTGDGDPVAQVRVFVPGGGRGVETAPDGRFELDGVPRSGGTVICLPRADYAPQRIDVLPDAGDVDRGDVILRPGGVIRGVVVDAEGKAVAGAVVEASREGLMDGYRSTKTDADGRFELTALADGGHTVSATWRSVQAPGSAEAAKAENAIPGGAELRIVMTSPRSLVIRFLNESDRSAVVVNEGAVTVTSVDGAADPLRMIFAGAGSSSFRMQLETAGLYDLQVEIPGYSIGELPGVEVRDDRGVEVEVLFRRAD